MQILQSDIGKYFLRVDIQSYIHVCKAITSRKYFNNKFLYTYNSIRSSFTSNKRCAIKNSIFRLQNGCPNNKIILGIATHGRTWTMDDDSSISGVPPFSAAGAGEAGPYTQQPGLLSYPEICSKIATPTEIQAGYLGKLRKVNDPTKRYGECKYLYYIYIN